MHPLVVGNLSPINICPVTPRAASTTSVHHWTPRVSFTTQPDWLGLLHTLDRQHPESEKKIAHKNGLKRMKEAEREREREREREKG